MVLDGVSHSLAQQHHHGDEAVLIITTSKIEKVYLKITGSLTFLSEYTKCGLLYSNNCVINSNCYYTTVAFQHTSQLLWATNRHFFVGVFLGEFVVEIDTTQICLLNIELLGRSPPEVSVTLIIAQNTALW